jgi:hypothetical protein
LEDDAGGDDFFGGLAKCGVISAAASSMMKFLDILEFRIRLESLVEANSGKAVWIASDKGNLVIFRR